MTSIIENISCPKDIKKLSPSELILLSKEIREMIVEVMSKNSGHLGASLGAVELAIGIHYCFNILKDNLVWDVGHQSYAHKILTGRSHLFSGIRQFKGISGFPSRKESTYDDFGTGHSSTSISAVLGMAVAKKLKGDESTSIAVIGDGSLTGGLAFEGLNNLAVSNVNAIVIINDNDMSIDPNVGGLQQHLNDIDITSNVFTNLGLNYRGVYNGNDLNEVLNVFVDPSLKKGVHVLHFRTKKGFGYKYAEDGNPTHWHAPGKFEVDSGEGNLGLPSTKKYHQVVGGALTKLMIENQNAVVITPAMASGSGLKSIEKDFPARFFDVGIAEQHAVTFSAGLAVNGIFPICVIYSTFLQRAYDQLIHDVALQKLKVVFLIDRAGLVGNDGPTHHGVFDLAYLNLVPEMTIYAPQTSIQLEKLILSSTNLSEGPIAIRYPRGNVSNSSIPTENYNLEDSVFNSISQTENLVITIGELGNKVKNTSDFDLLQLIKVKPIDYKGLMEVLHNYKNIVFVEDGVKLGGISQSIIAEIASNGLDLRCLIIALPDEFIEHGTQEELYSQYGMDAEGLNDKIEKFFNLN